MRHCEHSHSTQVDWMGGQREREREGGRWRRCTHATPQFPNEIGTLALDLVLAGGDGVVGGALALALLCRHQELIRALPCSAGTWKEAHEEKNENKQTNNENNENKQQDHKSKQTTRTSKQTDNVNRQ